VSRGYRNEEQCPPPLLAWPGPVVQPASQGWAPRVSSKGLGCPWCPLLVHPGGGEDRVWGHQGGGRGHLPGAQKSQPGKARLTVRGDHSAPNTENCIILASALYCQYQIPSHRKEAWPGDPPATTATAAATSTCCCSCLRAGWRLGWRLGWRPPCRKFSGSWGSACAWGGSPQSSAAPEQSNSSVTLDKFPSFFRLNCKREIPHSH
jgi:hypothetical protein